MRQQGSTGRQMREQHSPERGSRRTASRSAHLARRASSKLVAPSATLLSRHNLHSEQVVEIQRTRLLAGALVAVEEYGYADTTVAHITARARISRRTFYELFANCEECLAALFEYVVGLLEDELAQAELECLPWQERVRAGLWVILSFLDREPALARVCVVQAARGGARIEASRERMLASLATVVEDGRAAGSRVSDCSALTAEGLVGAACAIVYVRLSRERPEPLAELLGELMGMIVLPYLGPAAARREQTRPAPVAPPVSRHAPKALALSDGDPLQGLPMRLTYRTAQVLGYIAEHPNISNREVADGAGISDPGQISKLLARLAGLGLIANGAAGYAKGEPNAWELTPLGQRVVQRLRMSRDHGGASPASS
jgi:AcrR family transcriptional regulator/DNA-binding MarR family transcriptional regulator